MRFDCVQELVETVMVNLKQWLTDPETANNPTLQLIAGIIYMDQGELEEAAKVLHAGTTLEMVSLQVRHISALVRLRLRMLTACVIHTYTNA